MKPLVALAIGLFALHIGLVIAAIQRNYVTFDEPGHLQAGLSHWQTGKFSMYRVNPPLPRLLATVPVLFADPKTDWTDLERLDAFPAARAEFRMAEPFVRKNGERLFELVKLARYATLGWSLLGACVVFAWARERFGDKAGLLALGCWCLEPNILAHAALATPDVPATAMAITSLYVLRRFVARPCASRAAWFGVALGVALLTKLTLLVIVPISAIVVAARAPRRDRALGQLAAAGVLALVVVHAGYGFSGALPRLGSIPFVSDTFSGMSHAERIERGVLSGNRFESTWLGELPVPLPEQMVRGIDVQRRDFTIGLRSYLAGEWRNGGFIHYYAHALAVKVPLGLWALFAVATGMALRRARSAELTLLVPPLVVFALVSSQNGFSHHLRYVLPVFPFVFVHIGRVAQLMSAKTPIVRSVVPGLSAYASAASLAVTPFPLTHFNELAGGVEGGPRHLLNSNIDWGQGLLELEDWLDAHPEASRLGIAYFGQVLPEVEGLRYERVPIQPNVCSTEASRFAEGFGPKPGFYAVSVNYVFGGAHPVGDGQWRRRLVDPEDFAYFRELEPIARLAGSIYVYEIGVAEADRLRQRLCLPPLQSPSAELARADRSR